VVNPGGRGGLARERVRTAGHPGRGVQSRAGRLHLIRYWPGREPFGPGIRVEVGDGSGHCGGGRVPALFPGRPGLWSCGYRRFPFPQTAVATCGPSAAPRELAAGYGRYTW
jgi:hypothetical protein